MSLPIVLACLTSALSGDACAFQQPGQRPRLDAYGDPLPAGALARIGSNRLCNQGGLTGLAFSPDGKRLASENGSGHVRLWEAATGKEVRVMKAPIAGYGPLAFSPDGKFLASSAGGKLVCLWDPDTGRLLRRLEGHGDIRSIACAPNSELLATGSGDGSIVVWNARTGAVVHTLKGHRDAPTGLGFSLDSRSLASTGHDGSTRLWNLADGKESAKVHPKPFSNAALQFLPDGKTVIAAGGENNDGVLRFWDMSQGVQDRQIEAHTSGTLCLALSRNGKLLASGGVDKALRFWDPETTAELGQLANQANYVNQVALSPDGGLVAWSTYYGSRVRLGKLTRLDKSIELKELFPQSGHETAINRITFSPDGKRILSAGNDYTAILWDEATRTELHRFKLGYVTAWSPDSKLLALANVNDGNGMIFLHNADSGKEVQRFKVPTQVYSLAFAANGRSLTIGGTHGTMVLELASGKLRLAPSNANLWRAVVAPDGLTVAAIGKKDIGLRDLITGKEMTTLPLAVGSGPVAFSPDGRLLACGFYSEGIVLWDLSQRKEVRRIPGSAFDLAFMPDGQTLIAVCRDETTRLFDAETGKQRHQFQGHSGWIMSVAVSPDGSTLVTGSGDTTMLLWPLDNFMRGKPVPTPRLTEKEIRARLDNVPQIAWEDAWKQLAQPDAAKAYRAIWSLTGHSKEAMPELEKWLTDICTIPIARMIADLDNADFNRRDQATKELARLGGLADPALRDALAGKPSTEARRRIERILASREIAPADGPDEGLRLGRTIELLEYIGNADARALLELLAKQAPAAEPAQQARAALERLAKAAP